MSVGTLYFVVDCTERPTWQQGRGRPRRCLLSRPQGNVKPIRSLVEPLQVAMDNGAKRAFISIENKRQFLEVDPDVLEHVDPIFHGDLKQAAFKALGLN